MINTTLDKTNVDIISQRNWLLSSEQSQVAECRMPNVSHEREMIKLSFPGISFMIFFFFDFERVGIESGLSF